LNNIVLSVIKNNPIGVFDSGIGGLSIARQIRETLPNEDLIYVADTLHAPYGEQTSEYIVNRSLAMANYFVERQVKAIVVACNTATTSAIQKLRERYDIPIVGVEPGTKPAALHSNSGVIGVLATSGTLATESFRRLLERTAGPVKVELQACPDLVLQVESLELDSAQTRVVVNNYVSPLLSKGVDHIVLGCTHYNFLESLIKEVAGSQVNIVNTAKAVVNQLQRKLEDHDLLNNRSEVGNYEFYTSGEEFWFRKQIEVLWGTSSFVYNLPV